MEKQKTAVGRRKEAVTRVFLSKGEGKIVINDKDYKQYFSLVYLQNQVELPLKTVELTDKYDVKINATGGGMKGQAEAAKLGIARALLEVNPEFRPALKAAGLLRRDPRSVERKKPGRKKARRSFHLLCAPGASNSLTPSTSGLSSNGSSTSSNRPASILEKSRI
jgi:small subunit ribosomal protein S9